MMRRVGHRPTSETRCRFAADVVVARTAVTRNRTIASCCETAARQTQAQPARSPLRPPKTKCPNTQGHRRTAIAPPPAGSFPAGFRTPAPYPSHRPRRAGIRNPQHFRPISHVRYYVGDRRLRTWSGGSGALGGLATATRFSSRDLVSLFGRSLAPCSERPQVQPSIFLGQHDCNDARGHRGIGWIGRVIFKISCRNIRS